MYKSRFLSGAKALLLASLSISSASAQIIISEFMASNTRTLADEDGDYSDWIELLNLGSTNVNLNGWALTDDPADPRKWRFPATQIAPGENLVVFASNKDRRTVGNPLHTDFRLSADGDYLALADANGKIIFDFDAAYPAQAPDVSFGVTGEQTSNPILNSTTALTYFIPDSDALGSGWQTLELPALNWQTGTNGIGFDHNPPAAANPWVSTVTSSGPDVFYRMQEGSGSIATNAGSLGANYAGNYTGGALLRQTGVRPPEAPGMPEDNYALRLDGLNDYISLRKPLVNHVAAFTMAGWVKPLSLTKTRAGMWGQHEAIEVGFIDGRLLQVSTLNGGTVQAEFPLPANKWRFVAVTGDGEQLRIYIDGELLGEGGSPTGDYGSSQYPFVIGGGGIFDASDNWFSGHIDEFAYYTRALHADEIWRQWNSAAAPDSSYAPAIAHDVSAEMQGKNSSIYLRYQFDSAQAWEGLLLRTQTDDGFIAYLNGIEVARLNAPLEPAWNSSSTLDRPRTAGLQWREIDLSHAVGLLHPGANLLAVHGLNSSPDNPDFFFKAELLGLKRNIQTNSFRYFTQATPGEINGMGDLNAGPMILNVSHAPKIPSDADPILVTARMVKTFGEPLDLTLLYRVMFGTETSLPMRDDGSSGDVVAADGIYTARIPASAATMGQMVRSNLRARDTSGNITRWPPYRETRNSPQYLGTVIQDTRLTNNLPVLHWFVQNPSAAETAAGSRGAVFWDGFLYDNIFFNIHGQSSQEFPKKSYNIDFNTGHHFAWNPEEQPVEDINLLTTYPDKAHVRNILAYETFRDAGHPYHFVLPVRVQRNGAFFSDAHIVEDGDEDFLARVGLDSKGALYKMYNTLDSATTGAEKKTREFENNNDLQAFIAGLNRAGSSRTSFIYDNVNVPAMVNYLAALVLTGNVDCCHKNYYIYRDSEGTGEWQFLPWDLDLSFGRNWTGNLHYYDDAMYPNNPLFVGGNNTLPSALFAIPAIRQMYLRRVRTLMEELLQAPGTPAAELKYEKRIRELYELIGPDAALDFEKWTTWGSRQTMPQALSILTNQYMPARRNYLFNTLSNTLPGPTPANVAVNFGIYETNPTNGLQTQEFFSLVNPNNFAVDISGWTVQGGVDHSFAPGTVLPANGVLYLSPDVNSFRQRQSSPRAGQSLFVQGNYQGQLSARGETLELKDKTGRLVKSLTIPSQPTLGQQYLRVSEIMFAPGANSIGVAREELEYLTLKNIGPAPLNLKGVHFTNGITFSFTTDLQLSAGSSVYVAKNPTAFRSLYGNNLLVVGPYVGQLSNQGEVLELYDAGGEKILDFEYDNNWHPQADGRGYSLVVKDLQVSYSEWSEAATWSVSTSIGGTAAGMDGWTTFQSAYFTAAELADPLVSGAEADPDQDRLNNHGEFVAGTNPKNGASLFKMQILEADIANIMVEIDGVAGRIYSIWRTSGLANPTWERVSAPQQAAQNESLHIPIALPAGSTENYYFKVQVERPQ
ncbi:MAG: CotH kinase family protein [Verrucomicrobiales bacterium]